MMNLLVAVDFSTASGYAVQYAEWLSIKLSSRLSAVHIAPPGKKGERGPKETAEVPTSSYETGLLQKLQRFTTNYPDRSEEALTAVGQTDNLVRYGPAVKQIIATAEEIRADLIIVGTRAKHQLWNHLFGSTTTGLIAQSEIPVLVVPEGAAFKEVQKIALASDITLDETPLLKWLQQFADGLDAQVNQFFVNILPEEQTKWKEEYIRSHWKADSSLASDRIMMIRERSVIEGIDYYLEKYPAQMLALYVPQRAFPERILLHRSLSQQLAYKTRLPMLVIKERSINRQSEGSEAAASN